jgi:hypothetical protein
MFIRRPPGGGSYFEQKIASYIISPSKHEVLSALETAERSRSDVLFQIAHETLIGGSSMEGWSEEEYGNKELMAPCGLYCGVCAVYIATRDGNEKFKAIMGKLYGTKPEDTECLGCMQSDPSKKLYAYCKACKIRDCVKAKQFYSCHQCDEWPCRLAEDFPITTGRNVIKRTIPIWREKVAGFGDEKGSVEWARSECERYHCPSCGKPLFRGAQRCRVCKKEVANELDGSFTLS